LGWGSFLSGLLDGGRRWFGRGRGMTGRVLFGLSRAYDVLEGFRGSGSGILGRGGMEGSARRRAIRSRDDSVIEGFWGIFEECEIDEGEEVGVVLKVESVWNPISSTV
jgi:hypothetical protein